MTWGSGDWGTSAWGEGETSLLSTFFLNDAIAIAENRIRLTFSGVPYYSRLFDLYDASDARRFVVTEVAGTSGMDGNAVRLVTSAFVEKVKDDPVSLDVILDRPMTPFPAQYIVTVTGVATGTPPALMVINASTIAKQFLSTYRILNRPVIETGSRSRDFAMPQTRTDAFDPLPNPNNPFNLGTFPVDDTGDYAFDEGVASFRKRVIRRIISRKNSFAHIPEYGIGAQDYGKKLGTNANRVELVSSTEEQLSHEPEVEQIRVEIVPNAKKPNLFYLRVAVKLKTGTARRFDVPLNS